MKYEVSIIRCLFELDFLPLATNPWCALLWEAETLKRGKGLSNFPIISIFLSVVSNLG